MKKLFCFMFVLLFLISMSIVVAGAETEEYTTIAQSNQNVDRGVITVGDIDYEVYVGDSVIYTLTLTTPDNIEKISGFVSYDKEALIVDEVRTPILSGTIVNSDSSFGVYFDAEDIVNGFDFVESETLIEIVFNVNELSFSDININIDAMSELNGESYILDSEKLMDGVVIKETLEIQHSDVEETNVTEYTTQIQTTEGKETTEVKETTEEYVVSSGATAHLMLGGIRIVIAIGILLVICASVVVIIVCVKNKKR